MLLLRVLLSGGIRRVPGSRISVLPGVDQLDFLLAGMSGYVNVLEYDVGTLRRQFVDDVRNGFFISRDWVGTEDHGVARQDRDLLCRCAAIRDSAAMDSPWLPVVIRTSCSPV